MYRNWSARITAGPSLGRYISGTCRVGWLGADITAATAAGDFGAGIFINDQIDPIKRYRALLESSTFPAGALILRERGDGEFTANGTAVFGIFENNVRLGPTSFTGTIGAALGPLAGAPTTQNAASSAAAVTQTYILGGLNCVSVAQSSVGAVTFVHNLQGSSSTQIATSPGRALLGTLPRTRIPGRLVIAPARVLRLSATVKTYGGRPVSRTQEFSAKAPAEIIALEFDFSKLTAEPILPAVVVSQLAGPTDSAPQSMVSGVATVQGDGLVNQVVIGGLVGADYLVTCQVDTASGRRYTLSGVLPVRVR